MKKDDFWDLIPYFKKEEFTCKCKNKDCTLNNISHTLVDKLNYARFKASVPFNINSACRCTEHNRDTKGSINSSHLRGYAVDVKVDNSIRRFKILKSLIDVGFSRIGVYDDFIHVDIDDKKTQNVIWYVQK